MANEQLKQNYRDIANAIRSKTGENGTMTAEEMPSKIESIETGITPSGTINLTMNGTHDVAEYAEAKVNVQQPSGTKRIISNGAGQDIWNYAYADVYVEAVSMDSSAFSFDSELLAHKIFGLNTASDGSYTSCIDASMEESNGHKTFSCNIFGVVEALSVHKYNDELSLVENSDWYYNTDSLNDAYYVMCSCIRGKCDTLDVRTDGLVLAIDEDAKEEAKSFLESEYSSRKIIFTDLLGNVIAEKYIKDMAEGGGS